MEISDKERQRRAKISNSSKGRIAWNKGLTNCLTDEGRKRKAEACSKQWKGKPKSVEHKKHISDSLVGHESLVGRDPNKGSFKPGLVPWNKGKVFAAISQEKNPLWKGGISSEYDKARCHRFLFVDWTKLVKDRDENKCRHCNGTDRLRAHHIKDFVEYPELRYDVNNGLTLCISSHSKEHQRLNRLKKLSYGKIT